MILEIGPNIMTTIQIIHFDIGVIAIFYFIVR